MNYVLLTIVALRIFIFTGLYASDCGELKQGEVIRLDSKGGSLENFRARDQDGLGNCYAQSSSVILQSILPNHPEISSLQVAAIHSEIVQEDIRLQAESLLKTGRATVAERFALKDSREESGWDLALNGGSVCNTVQQIKKLQTSTKSPVLCPRSKTNLERRLGNGDPNFKTFKTLLETSKYMNQYHKDFDVSNPDTAMFREKFNKLIDQKNSQLINRDCKKINADGLESILYPLIAQAMNYLPDCKKSNGNKPNPTKCKIAQAIVPDFSENGDFQYNVNHIGSPLLNKMKTLLEKPGKNYSIDQMKADFKSALLAVANIPNSDLKSATGIADIASGWIPSEQLNDLVNEFNEIKKTGNSKKCQNRLMADYLTHQNFEQDWGQVGLLCTHQALMKQIPAVILEYNNSGLSDIGNALSFLNTNAGNTYHDALMSLYANDCQADDKMAIPSNLSCQVHAVTFENKAQTDAIILNNLRNNKAVSFGFCSSVLDMPGQLNSNDPKCGTHEVFIKGIKCVNGKMEYLIQNSWGKNPGTPKNSEIKLNDNDGSYWFSENTFYESAIDITTLNLGDEK